MFKEAFNVHLFTHVMHQGLLKAPVCVPLCIVSETTESQLAVSDLWDRLWSVVRVALAQAPFYEWCEARTFCLINDNTSLY